MKKPHHPKRETLKSTFESADKSDSNFDPWILWVTARRSWLWALPAGLILAALSGVLVIQSFEPVYRARHFLEANQDFVVFKNVMPTVKNIAKTEKPLFYLPVVLDPVLMKPELRSAPSLKDPAKAESELMSRLSVRSAGTDTRLEVTYDDSDPEYAAEICNAVVESYLELRLQYDNNRVRNLERWLQPEIELWENRVEEEQSRVHQLSKLIHGSAHGQRATTIETENNFALLSKLRMEIADLDLQISIGQARLAMQTSNQESDPKSAIIDVNNITEENLASLGIYVSRIEPTEAQIGITAERDPDVIKANERIRRYESAIMSIEDASQVGLKKIEYRRFQASLAEWQDKLEQAKASAKERAIKQLEEIAESDYRLRMLAAKQKAMQMMKENDNNRKLVLEEEKSRQDDLKTRMVELQKQYDAEKLELESFGGITAEFQFAQEERNVANGVLTKLRDRVAAIRTERRQDGAVRTMTPASAPRTPLEEVPYKKLILACLAGLLLPFGLALLIELRTHRLTDSEMCDKNGLQVIGEIARLPNRSTEGKDRRVFEESVDSMRASLFLSVDTRESRSFAVVSGMSGEGKSSVSSQLALSIAKATGETVLLVDGDMRCPDQHSIFGLSLGPGLSAVLAQKVSLTEGVNTSYGDLVHILPAGELSTSPHRLISPDRMRKFIDEALKEYSYVVVDTPPVLSAGEALAVAASVDSTLLCVMRDVSRMDNVTRTKRRLEASGATLAGLVFSGVSARQYAYRYGDYRYSMGAGVDRITSATTSS